MLEAFQEIAVVISGNYQFFYKIHVKNIVEECVKKYQRFTKQICWFHYIQLPQIDFSSSNSSNWYYVNVSMVKYSFDKETYFGLKN